MPIQGLRDSNQFVADSRPKNYRELILRLYPNGSAPLTALTNAMSSGSTDDPEFAWWEKALPSQRLAVSVALTNVATAVVCSGRSTPVKGMFRSEKSGELMLVTADPTADTGLTVSRGSAGTSAVAIDPAVAGTNPYLHAVGNINEEGSMPPTGVNYDPTKKYNYTQIFRNTLEMTRTASKTRLRTGDQVKEAKRECLELHSIEMEKGFIWGARVETTKNGKPMRMTGGILAFIAPQNIIDLAGAATDMMKIESMMKDMFTWGSSEKVSFMGNTSLMVLQQIIRKNSTFNIQSGIKEYGMNVSRPVCPFGELVMKTHPLFNQMPGGTTAGTAYRSLDSDWLTLDMKEIKYRYFSGDDTRYEKQLEPNGMDGMQSGYLTECGLEIHHPLTHYYVKGLTTPAKDA
jgi:hypothetical protein